MARRMFYVSDVSGGSAYLTGETAQHLRKVLRAEKGQRYEVSDGEQMYLAEVAEFGKDLVELKLLEPLAAAAAPVRLRLFAALIKFDRFEWMIEKATELGVERVTPVYSAYCDKGLDQAAVKRAGRWKRIAMESGQQSRRLRPPEIDEPVKFRDVLAGDANLRLFLDELPGAPAILGALPAERAASDRVDLLCGPEGGWDEAEREAALKAGWLQVSVGTQILRAETAAIAALAVVSAAWQAGRV
jgi:16S rRNA (uracil1498-N3)-methyltransferase